MAKQQQKSIPVNQFHPRLPELIDLVQQGRAFNPPSMAMAQEIAMKAYRAAFELETQDIADIPPGTPGVPDSTTQRQQLKDSAMSSLNDVFQQIYGEPIDPEGTTITPPTRTLEPIVYPLNPPTPYDPKNGGYADPEPLSGGLTDFMEHQLSVLPQLMGLMSQGAQFAQLLTPTIANACEIVDQIIGAVTGFINDTLNQLLVAMQPLLDAISRGLAAVLGMVNTVLGVINDVLNLISQFILDQIAALVNLLGQLYDLLPIQSLIGFLTDPCVNFIFQTATNGGISTQAMANTLSSINPGAII